MDARYRVAYLRCKRIWDLLAAILFLPLLIVIIVLISIILLISQGSPVLFRQQRAGLKGRPFTLLKFRTMKSGIDPYGPSPKDGRDDRITPIGGLLRMSSLDELPQFLNVLSGKMSLVGPRPLYVEQIEEWSDRHKRRLEVKPGITGLAQVSGRGSLTIEEKLELDVQYVEQQSFLLDAKILLMTFVRLVKPTGIYEKRYSADQMTRGEGD